MTTKYKHKQTGDIAERVSDTSVVRYYNAGGNILAAKYIEGCSDWEPVQDSLYEIIALYQMDGNTMYKYPVINGIVHQAGCTDRSIADGDEGKIEQIMKWGTWLKIHSIKILSTQEVYTVGDWIVHSNCRPEERFQIDTFQLGVQNDIWANPKDSKGYCHMNYWRKVPVVICTTVDGKSITDPGQIVYCLYGDWTIDRIGSPWNAKGVSVAIQEGTHIGCKWFLTEEARQEYIINNKPVLSYTDVWKAWQAAEDNRLWNDMKIKELVQEKLKQQ